MVKQVQRFEIVFSSQSNTFYAGNALTGRVLVELNEPMKVKGVRIKCLGQAFVSFSDAHKYTKSHTEKAQYMDECRVLYGSQSTSITSSETSVTLEPGTHEYAFSIPLPANLPTSYESKHGHVRYTAKATLNRPWKFDLNAKSAFTVVSCVDLNREPLAFTPGFGRTVQRFTLTERIFSCLKGGLSVQIKIDRSAFVPGEFIPLNVEVLNNSSKRVKKVETFLQQNLICNTKSGSRFFPGMEKIGLVTHGVLGPGEALVWVREPLAIPPLPPTKLGGCKLLSIDYLLKLTVYLNSGREIRLSMPIVIGSIPLHQHNLPWIPEAAQQQQHQPPPQLPNQPSPNVVAVTPAEPTAPPLDMDYLGPPPSYEECLFMDAGEIRDSEDDQHTQGALTYRPSYPLYPTLRPQPGNN